VIEGCWERARAVFAECGDKHETEHIRMQLANLGSDFPPGPRPPRRANATVYYDSEPGQQGSGY
jgi:hypothetical protein